MRLDPHPSPEDEKTISKSLLDFNHFFEEGPPLPNSRKNPFCNQTRKFLVFYRGADIASPPTDSIFRIPGLGVALSLSKHVPGFRRPKFQKSMECSKLNDKHFSTFHFFFAQGARLYGFVNFPA